MSVFERLKKLLACRSKRKAKRKHLASMGYYAGYNVPRFQMMPPKTANKKPVKRVKNDKGNYVKTYKTMFAVPGLGQPKGEII